MSDYDYIAEAEHIKKKMMSRLTLDELKDKIVNINLRMRECYNKFRDLEENLAKNLNNRKLILDTWNENMIYGLLSQDLKLLLNVYEDKIKEK